MPFLTEELWQRLASGSEKRLESLALARFPDSDSAVIDGATENEMAVLQEIITAARNLRAEMKADPKEPLDGELHSSTRALELAAAHQDVIQKFAGVRLELHKGAAPRTSGARHSTPEFDLVLRLPVAQAGAQRLRLMKQIEQLEKVIESSRRQLADERFLSRAPAHVVESIRAKLGDYEAQSEKSRAALEVLPLS